VIRYCDKVAACFIGKQNKSILLIESSPYSNRDSFLFESKFEKYRNLLLEKQAGYIVIHMLRLL